MQFAGAKQKVKKAIDDVSTQSGLKSSLVEIFCPRLDRPL
jgi:hypothetical protein